MSTSLSTLSTELQRRTQYQRTPTTITSSEYLDIITNGVKGFYIDVGLEDSWSTEYDSTANTISRTLNITETEYCLLKSEIGFLEMVSSNWNTMVSYVTNALSVANATKPYEFMSNNINKKKEELINLFNRMTEYSTMSDIDAVTVEKIDYTYES